jgi:hypothetical protein
LNFVRKVADQFATATAGPETAVKENVPTPGRLESDGPAIEGPHRMKARARRKLVVRIIKGLRFQSPFAGNVIPHRCFRLSAQKAENGFVTKENCFVGTRRRNIHAGKRNDFRGESSAADTPVSIAARSDANQSVRSRPPACV